MCLIHILGLQGYRGAKKCNIRHFGSYGQGKGSLWGKGTYEEKLPDTTETAGNG